MDTTAYVALYLLGVVVASVLVNSLDADYTGPNMATRHAARLIVAALWPVWALIVMLCLVVD